MFGYRDLAHESSDSYPEGLGRSLVRMIPSDPAKYREWLKQKRAIYSKAEAMLQSQVLSVTPTRVRNGNIVPLQACGLQDLERLPTYDGMSECDL